jgi:hypothetical protein
VALSGRALGRFRSNVASGGDFLTNECIELFLYRAACSWSTNQCVRLGHAHSAPHRSEARHRNDEEYSENNGITEGSPCKCRHSEATICSYVQAVRGEDGGCHRISAAPRNMTRSPGRLRLPGLSMSELWEIPRTTIPSSLGSQSRAMESVSLAANASVASPAPARRP